MLCYRQELPSFLPSDRRRRGGGGGAVGIVCPLRATTNRK